MLYTNKYIFLHFPKAAGKTLTRFFLGAWSSFEIRGIISKGQFKEVQDLITENVKLDEGKGHENLKTSLKIFSESSFTCETPKAIFVCIRNPYDLAVSTYFFQRKMYKHNKEKKNFELASKLSLKDYWTELSLGKPENWFAIDGVVPENLELIRFEQIVEDTRLLCLKYELNCPDLDHLNAINRRPFSEYYDQELEKIIYERFRFFFDKGFYARSFF